MNWFTFLCFNSVIKVWSFLHIRSSYEFNLMSNYQLTFVNFKKLFDLHCLELLYISGYMNERWLFSICLIGHFLVIIIHPPPLSLFLKAMFLFSLSSTLVAFSSFVKLSVNILQFVSTHYIFVINWFKTELFVLIASIDGLWTNQLSWYGM